MRTTLTLDDDVAAKLRAEARKSGRSFKETVNQVLRLGLHTGEKPASKSNGNNGHSTLRAREGDLDVLLAAMKSAKDGDFTVRLPLGSAPCPDRLRGSGTTPPTIAI